VVALVTVGMQTEAGGTAGQGRRPEGIHPGFRGL